MDQPWPYAQVRVDHVRGADEGDTTTIVDIVTAAVEQVEAAQADVDDPQPLEEIITDKGYHSNRIMVELDALGVRSYVEEPDRGRRDWSKEPEAQAPAGRDFCTLAVRRHARPARRSDHARGQLVSIGDLYHGLLGGLSRSGTEVAGQSCAVSRGNAARAI